MSALATAPLIQIQKRYSGRLNGLVLSVESGADQWTASVVDPASRTSLYTAHRFSAHAAKLAAVEFASFAECGLLERTDEVAKHLKWTEGW